MNNEQQIAQNDAREGEYSVGYRETAEFKKGVEALESLGGLSAIEKARILAVALNVKKAAEFDVDTDDASVATVEEILTNLGVRFFDHTEYVAPDEGHERRYFLIGATVADLQEAMRAPFPSVGPEEHRQFGEAMDFPDTVIRAWQRFKTAEDRSELLDWEDPRLTDEEKAFSFFRMSSGNWEEEIAWLEQIIAAVREYSPTLYEQVMQSYQKQKGSSA